MEAVIKLSALNITPQKEKQFNSKGIFTAEDLIRFLPRDYLDFTKETGILPETEVSCVSVKLTGMTNRHSGKVSTVTGFCTELKTKKKIVVTWFNQSFMSQRLNPYIGHDFYLCGKMQYNAKYDNYSVAMPDLFEPNTASAKRVVPVYSKIRGMSDAYLTGKIRDTFTVPGTAGETLPFDLVTEKGLMNIKEALYALHFPMSMQQVARAKERILFDDLLFFALCNEWSQRSAAKGSPYSIKTMRLMNEIRSDLPYTLTDDQVNAVQEMVNTCRDGHRINALVQGDVGCGKSIIAFLMMAGFIDSGYQACLMAPTQVLARQHYNELQALVGDKGYRVVYLGSELKAREKKAALSAIESGEAQFIVGTHACVAKDVRYHALALAITDEEHKFGVAQRSSLVEKASAGVHSITMSATPIPRSLAQIVYGGGVQCHTIQTMPAGRKPVITGIAKSRERIYKFLLNQVRHGHQAYVVCPMIETNEEMENVESVESISAAYREALEPSGVRIATLTGRDSKEDTERIIESFRKGEIHILIATSVIEVGVNVANATAMVISSAERFGLASLHQLRGRVGRSDLQAYCVLESRNLTEKAQQRLDAIVRTTNGFEIAEADLAMRGAGDLLGTKQSGSNKYMELMLSYPDKYEEAQRYARELLDAGTRCPMVSAVMALEEAA